MKWFVSPFLYLIFCVQLPRALFCYNEQYNKIKVSVDVIILLADELHDVVTLSRQGTEVEGKVGRRKAKLMSVHEVL